MKKLKKPFKKNKKGILLTNAVSAVIAVLGIIALFWGIYQLYTIDTTSDEQKAAQHLLDIVMAKVDALQNEQSTTASIQSFSSNGNWYLTGWDKTKTARPDKCFFENCICICKSDKPLDVGKDGSYCQKQGYCRKVKDDLVYVSTHGKGPNVLSSSIVIQNEQNVFFDIKISKSTNQDNKKVLSLSRTIEEMK